MCKRLCSILLLFIPILLLSPSRAASQTQGIKELEPVKKSDRILILAPHPDDETIGCAGVIQQAHALGAQVKIVYLTNGDHNQVAFIVYEKRLTLRTGEFIHMGEVRRREAIKAMKLLGLSENNLIFLGYPDFGTFTIFGQYWQTKKPFKSLLTRISSVPYKENMSFGAPYKGESILSDLKSVLLKYKPNKIFVSHPADTNVDHKALYLFLQIALADLNKNIPNPKVYPYLIHCIGWPRPRHYHPGLTLEPPQKFSNSQINWQKYALAPNQLNKKYQAILCYKSQTESSAFYLLSFARKNELFGDYPEQTLNFGEINYAVKDNSIFIRIKQEKEFKRGFGFQLYLFGYSYKTPFAAMPKLRIIAKNNKFKVLDVGKRITPPGISLQLDSNALVLQVPLEVLGNPEFILTSIKAYGGALPVDTIGFRKIYIK